MFCARPQLAEVTFEEYPKEKSASFLYSDPVYVGFKEPPFLPSHNEV